MDAKPDLTALPKAFEKTVNLCCHLPGTMPAEQLLRYAKQSLQLKQDIEDLKYKWGLDYVRKRCSGKEDLMGQYKEALRQYENVIQTWLKDAIHNLAQVFQQSNLHVHWLGTVSFISLIKPNPWTGKPPCRISYFYNSVTHRGADYPLPLLFQLPSSHEASVQVSGSGMEDRQKAIDSFMALLDYLRCPPSSMTAYFGKSLSVSCLKYFEKLFGQREAAALYKDPQKTADHAKQLFDLYRDLREARDFRKRPREEREINQLLAVRGLDIDKLRSAMKAAISSIRFGHPPGFIDRAGETARRILRRPSPPGRNLDWDRIDKIAKEKKWGDEITLEPMFPIAGVGGQFLNLYYSGLQPMEPYDSAVEKTLCGLVAVALFQDCAAKLGDHQTFNQLMICFTQSIMMPLTQVELLALNENGSAGLATLKQEDGEWSSGLIS